MARLDVASGELAYLHADRLGTPQVATLGTQGVVWRAIYEPFGAATITSIGPFAQPLRYPGQFADPTGYYQNGFRDYDPTLGRYLESNPIGFAGGLNPYAYAGSNPVGTVDKWGLGDSAGDRSGRFPAGLPGSVLPDASLSFAWTPSGPGDGESSFVGPDGSVRSPGFARADRQADQVERNREWPADQPRKIDKVGEALLARIERGQATEIRDFRGLGRRVRDIPLLPETLTGLPGGGEPFAPWDWH